MHYYGSCSEGSTVLAVADLHSIKLRNKIILQLIQRVIKYVSKPLCTRYHYDQYCATHSGLKEKIHNIAQQNTDGV